LEDKFMDFTATLRTLQDDLLAGKDPESAITAAFGKVDAMETPLNPELATRFVPEQDKKAAIAHLQAQRAAERTKAKVKGNTSHTRPGKPKAQDRTKGVER
jgi:hypothetical protein